MNTKPKRDLLSFHDLGAGVSSFDEPGDERFEPDFIILDQLSRLLS